MNDSRSLFTTAFAHHVAGRLTEAEPLYRQILANDPNCPDALHYLGVIGLQVGQLDVALELLSRAEAAQPRNADLLNNLGETYRRLERRDEALIYLRRAVEIDPVHRDAYNNLGALYRDQRRSAEAEAAFRRATEVRPESSVTYFNLGNALFDQEKFEPAIQAYERSLALKPDSARTQLNFGCALRQSRRLDEAMAAFNAALVLEPDLADAHRMLGTTYFDRGRVELAVKNLRRARALAPREIEAYRDLAFIVPYLPGCDAARVLAEPMRWQQQHAEFGAPARHDNHKESGRPIRVGYVSPDFRTHVVGCNLVPLFKEREREHFQIFCYSNVAKPDSMTAEFREQVDSWCDITRLSDQEVCEQIRADQIDILVDLALHSPGNRLLVFARKPAPIQVTFAGYPGTTGLTAIDYRLTDPYLDPPGLFDAFYSECSIRLPHSFWCYEPFDANADPGPPPAEKNGFVTFGCLNTFCKVNRTTLSLWASVLRAVPDSRLTLLAPPGSHREDTFDFLRNLGVDGKRVTFVGRAARQGYFENFRQIDISLDTLPYNGHTTGLDSLWMGVPVVTLVGETVVGRAGWSQLSNLGLTELAATAPDQFVEIATRLATDLPRLAELRRTLRTRMKNSPLTDAKGFTRGIEAAYRAMWERWCESSGD